MQIRDLIEQLKQFPPTDRVCVEVTAEACHEFASDCECAVNFTVAKCERENDGTHGVRLTLEV